MNKNRMFVYLLLCVGWLVCPKIVSADWAGCYSEVSSKKSYSYGDIITYDLGSSGVTSNSCINGFHYQIEYDPTVLEVVSEKNGGVGSYHGWEDKELGIIYKDSYRYQVVEVIAKTEDKSKFVLPGDNTSVDDFVKLGYVKFKVINDDANSTKITLIQNWEDKVKHDYSLISYKMIYDYDNGVISKNGRLGEDAYQEGCYDDVVTHINIYKKAFLDNININGYDIKNFNKEVYKYDLTYTTEKIDISVSAEDDFKISGDIGERTLKYGNNVFKITVTSSTGDKKEYTLNINYPDDRSDVNTLKSLTLSKGKINFKSKTNEYDVEVANEIDSITIKSELTDSKSSYVKDFGNRKVNLKVGKNVILIKVLSEKGEENVYTLNVVRKKSSIVPLIKEFKIEGYDLDFDSNINNYSLKVDKELSKLNIKLVLGNENATYKIVGNENLKNGSQVYIKVTDEKKKERVYVITIEKETEIPEIDDNEIIDNNEKVETNDNSKNNKNMIIVAVITGVVVVGIVVGLAFYFGKKKNSYN